jgi:hypothetical protein
MVTAREESSSSATAGATALPMNNAAIAMRWRKGGFRRTAIADLMER